MGYRDYSTAKGHIVDSTGHGDFTTISAAITAASSGQTIFIRPGTYTENPTLKAGVNLAAYICDSENPSVIIRGKCTFTTAGVVTISGICLQTNSDYFLTVSGSAASLIYLKECFLNCVNNTGISFTSSNSAAFIGLFNCQGDVLTTGITYFTNTAGVSGTNNMIFQYCYLLNTGNSTTSSSITVANTNIDYTEIYVPLAASGSGAFGIDWTYLNTSAISVACLVTSGSNPCIIDQSQLVSGSAPCITTNTPASVSTFLCSMSTVNTDVVTGTGSFAYGLCNFPGGGTTIAATTKLAIPLTSQQGGTGLDNSGLTINLSNGASGKFLISDANGNASWQTFPLMFSEPVDESINIASPTSENNNIQSGFWTPTLAFGGSFKGIIYSVQEGDYTKIGGMVFFRLQIVLENKGSATGKAIIKGLPFKVKGNQNIPSFACCCKNLTSSGTFQGNAIAKTTTLSLDKISDTNELSQLTGKSFSDETSIEITGFYFSE